MAGEMDQRGGFGSTNHQAGGNIIINQGITAAEAHEIALNVFRANALQLAGEARSLYESRAERLNSDFLALAAKQAGLLDAFGEPGFQHALFHAQRAFGISGELDLERLLVNLLSERATEKSRTMRQIVLDECLATVSDLAPSEIAVLTIVWLSGQRSFHGIKYLSAADTIARTYCKFLPDVDSDPRLLQHLERRNCIVWNTGDFVLSTFTSALASQLEFYISEPIYASTLRRYFGSWNGYVDYFYEDEGEPDRLRCRYPNRIALAAAQDTKPIMGNEEMRLIGIFPENDGLTRMARFLKQWSCLAQLNDVWRRLEYSRISLTPVGEMIGTLNWSAQTRNN